MIKYYDNTGIMIILLNGIISCYHYQMKISYNLVFVSKHEWFGVYQRSSIWYQFVSKKIVRINEILFTWFSLHWNVFDSLNANLQTTYIHKKIQLSHVAYIHIADISIQRSYVMRDQVIMKLIWLNSNHNLLLE